MFGLIPLANTVVKFKDVACQYGLGENLLVVKCAVEMVISHRFLNCPSGHGTVAGHSVEHEC